jgi:hypothetical protein
MRRRGLLGGGVVLDLRCFAVSRLLAGGGPGVVSWAAQGCLMARVEEEEEKKVGERWFRRFRSAV